jgi:hypothetical protein
MVPSVALIATGLLCEFLWFAAGGFTEFFQLWLFALVGFTYLGCSAVVCFVLFDLFCDLILFAYSPVISLTWLLFALLFY